MAIDNKYGRVTTERGTIGENEPVVVFRAQDALLPDVLHFYEIACRLSGSPTRHLELIRKTRRQVLQWQEDYPTKIPSSDSLQ